MTGVLFILGFASLALLGAPMAPFGPSLGGGKSLGIALAAACGSVALALSMILLSWVGIPWRLWLLAPLAVAITLLGAALVRRTCRSCPARKHDRDGAWLAYAVTGLALLLVTYAAGSARATSTDLLFFWGAKGIRLAGHRGIDAAFLRDPHHLLMHPDYPPLWPLLEAWSTLLAGRFAWGAMLLTLPLFLALSAAAFHGAVAMRLPRRAAARATMFLTAVVGYCLVVSETAGNADAPLLFFEVLALVLVVVPAPAPRKCGDLLAGLALAGCALTKIEGTTAAILLVGIVTIGFRRGDRFGAFLRLAAPPALALGTWLFFCIFHRIPLQIFGLTRGGLSFNMLPRIVGAISKNASYGAWYLPWIILAVLFLSRRRAASIAALFGAGLIAVDIFFYLHASKNPEIWIGWSAARLLTPTIAALLIAAFIDSGRNSDTSKSRPPIDSSTACP